KRLIHNRPVLVCHAPYTCKRLAVAALFAFDFLGIYAFVHPAVFAVPTPPRLAKAVGLPHPAPAGDYPFTMIEAAQALLSDLRQDPWRGRADPMKVAGVMGQNGKGWVWTPFIFAAFGKTYDPKIPVVSQADLNVWRSLPE